MLIVCFRTLISSVRITLKDVTTSENTHYLEAQGGLAYWPAWRSVQVVFPKKDVHRVPEHWGSFGARISPLTHSPRLAVNPPNAILNYLYAILEAETRLAIAALGLDPGLGFLHFDSRTRDSLVCDVMEPVRPQVDAYLLEWLGREPLRKEWFCEQRDGNCRLMGSFAARLAETAPAWSRAVAPFAEWVARVLWGTLLKPTSRRAPAARLTQNHRRTAKGVAPNVKPNLPPRPPTVCRMCGTVIGFGRRYCPTCNLTIAREGMIEAAKLGRVKGHSPEALARQSEKQRKHAAAVQAWNPSDKPPWLTEEVFLQQIQPRVAALTVPIISSAIGVSDPYAAPYRGENATPGVGVLRCGPERNGLVRIFAVYQD